ncbi:MAG: non-canonical purine NTP pyrophosphatase, partial [Gammaproteobacteria bacterium]
MNAQPRRVVLASGNAGKLREFSALLAPLGLDLVPQSALGVPPAAEPFETFLENALAKARHASAFTGLPALADDSGICVDALGGRPGVRSARWAATAGDADEDADAADTRTRGAAAHAIDAAEGDVDAANNARLVADLAPFVDRSA